MQTLKQVKSSDKVQSGFGWWVRWQVVRQEKVSKTAGKKGWSKNRQQYIMTLKKHKEMLELPLRGKDDLAMRGKKEKCLNREME